MKCKKCESLCDSGAVMLNDGAIICACCVYEHLGSDNDNGNDWSVCVMEDAASEISAKIDKQDG